MCQNAAIRREQPCFGRNDLPSLRHNPSFGSHAACIQLDRSGEVAFGLDCGVAGTCRQQRLAGTGGGAVDQRERPTAVDHARWVEHIRARLALECGEAIANFDQPERQYFRNRRLRQTAIDDALQQFLAAHGGDFWEIQQTVVVSGHVFRRVRVRAAARTAVLAGYQKLRRLLARRLGEHDLKHQQPRSHHDRAIGHVEGWPLVRAYIEEEKIYHVAADETVPQIADCASQDQ